MKNLAQTAKNKNIAASNSRPFFSKEAKANQLFNNPITEPFFSPTTIQPKLTVNEPGDAYEQEADAMAERAMRFSENNNNGNSITFRPMPITSIQRKCAACEGEERLQRMEEPEEEQPVQPHPLMRKAAGGGYRGTPQLSADLNSSKGGGASLPGGIRQFMEHSFRTDFSGVRVHTDERAGKMSKGIQAKAFTHGRDIYFNRGQYSPESTSGKRLLAHELTHVNQQNPGTKIYRAVASNYETIDDRLSYGVIDWAITDGDAHEVLQILHQLNPEDLADTLRQMAADGLVTRLLENISSEDQGNYPTLISSIQQNRQTAEISSHIEDLLSYGILDWAVMDWEVRLVLSTLRDLQREENGRFETVVRAIPQTQFERFFDNLPESDRIDDQGFLQRIRDVRASPTSTADTPDEPSHDIDQICFPEGEFQPGQRTGDLQRLMDCRYHVRFLAGFDQAVRNIARISSPYSATLATVYQHLRELTEENPSSFPTSNPRELISVQLGQGEALQNISVYLILEREGESAPNEGSYSPLFNAFRLNEKSFGDITAPPDEWVVRVSELENVLYHEGIHFLEDIITRENENRRGQNPPLAPIHTYLDLSQRERFRTDFIRAAKPIWESFPDLSNIEQALGNHWDTMSLEVIAWLEGKIYENARVSRGFTENDLAGWNQEWVYRATYWFLINRETSQGAQEEALAFQRHIDLPENMAQIDAKLLPVIRRIQSDYLSNRPGSTAAGPEAGQ